MTIRHQLRLYQNTFPNLAEWTIGDFPWMARSPESKGVSCNLGPRSSAKARARIFVTAVNQDTGALSHALTLPLLRLCLGCLDGIVPENLSWLWAQARHRCSRL